MYIISVWRVTEVAGGGWWREKKTNIQTKICFIDMCKEVPFMYILSYSAAGESGQIWWTYQMYWLDKMYCILICVCFSSQTGESGEREEKATRSWSSLITCFLTRYIYLYIDWIWLDMDITRDESIYLEADFWDHNHDIVLGWYRVTIPEAWYLTSDHDILFRWWRGTIRMEFEYLTRAKTKNCLCNSPASSKRLLLKFLI